MNLALGCSMDLKDLFCDFPTHKLTSFGLYKGISNKILAERIFKDCFKMVLEDVIDNRVVFNLPNIGGVTARLYCKMYDGDQFKIMYKHGYWRGLDYLQSNFKGALPTIVISNKLKQEKYRTFFIDKNLKGRLIDKLNKGYQYYY